MICKKCGQQISNTAIYCDYCGKKVKPEKTVARGNKSMIALCLICIIMLVCVGVLAFMFTGQHDEKIVSSDSDIIKSDSGIISSDAACQEPEQIKVDKKAPENSNVNLDKQNNGNDKLNKTNNGSSEVETSIFKKFDGYQNILGKDMDSVLSQIKPHEYKGYFLGAEFYSSGDEGVGFLPFDKTCCFVYGKVKNVLPHITEFTKSTTVSKGMFEMYFKATSKICHNAEGDTFLNLPFITLESNGLTYAVECDEQGNFNNNNVCTVQFSNSLKPKNTAQAVEFSNYFKGCISDLCKYRTDVLAEYPDLVLTSSNLLNLQWYLFKNGGFGFNPEWDTSSAYMTNIMSVYDGLEKYVNSQSVISRADFESYIQCTTEFAILEDGNSYLSYEQGDYLMYVSCDSNGNVGWDVGANCSICIVVFNAKA